MSTFSDIVKYLPILSKANWYYLGIVRYTSQLESIVRWGKLQIQCFIFLFILGCPEILVNIFKRGSSSTSRMCVYLSGSQKSLKIVGCWLTLIHVFYNSELQLDSVKYYPNIVQYCMILVKLGWYCQILPDIAWCWKESFRYF